MEYNNLGKTGLKVSKLCFGTLTLSPLQKNLPLDIGTAILSAAYDLGVNFFDTAEIYDNYDYLKKAFHDKDDVIIATKSYSYDKKTAEESLEKALKGLDRDYIDIFLLHEQESEYTLKGHMQAIEYFLEMKDKGKIKAFGISTHFIKGVKAANKADYIDVIHPMVNMTGIGIVDGTIDEMLLQIEQSKIAQKGIYSMKAIGGGHLIKDVQQALGFVRDNENIDSVAVGMQSVEELIYNIDVFAKRPVDEYIKKLVSDKPRELFIHHDWCIKCQKCIKRCKQNALSFENNMVVIDKERCVLCSYCSLECSEMAIKII